MYYLTFLKHGLVASLQSGPDWLARQNASSFHIMSEKIVHFAGSLAVGPASAQFVHHLKKYPVFQPAVKSDSVQSDDPVPFAE